MNHSDNSVELKPNDIKYFVGVGASAGGLEALELLFSNMPLNSGMAFIVIQHLSPDYKSLMVELLSKRTQMAVKRAEDGMLIHADTIYLIPPKKNLSIFHGKVVLSELDSNKGINLPIDFFLKSLAEDQEEKAIAIILSGTGSDGVKGIRSIKEAGGMVMVQSEESAKFDGMPKAAISTGLADFVLSPEEMPKTLLTFIKQPYSNKPDGPQALLSDEDGLTRIYALLREKTRVDFTYYKPSTIVRRIERRMTVNQVQDLRDYVRLLESTHGELNILFRELLIGVTSFFRDKEVFDYLFENLFQGIFGNNPKKEIRFWVAGCSTGEEAYTLAILCREYMEKHSKLFDVKIFATDIDRDAIIKAGNGIYPETISVDIPSHLLNKYFNKKDDSYVIDRSIREMVVFAQHNIFKDPPFTNIDLVSCRNLLIYFQPVLQKKVMELFNFSLRKDGILLLGTSETVGEMVEQFECLHNKNKIYHSTGKKHHTFLTSDLGNISQVNLQKVRGKNPSAGIILRHAEEERTLDRLLQMLAEDYVPFAVVVNENFEVQHIIGDSSPYFFFPSGKLTNEISKIVSKELSIPLTTGLQKVFKNKEELRYNNVRVVSKDSSNNVNLHFKLIPSKKGQEPFAVVFFNRNVSQETDESKTGTAVYDISRETEQRMNDLEQELQFTRENLQATIEELETSNEELQATNEELLASNEELQSTNEELQSVNEELHTVNAEYQSKILELTELNNDLDNLFANIKIGTIFLDENLEIRKFTSEATKIYKLVTSDVGRPLSHIVHNIKGIDPIISIKEVVESGTHKEIDITTQSGDWFIMRILPYKIAKGIFSGIMLSFIDVNPLVAALKRAEKSELLFENISEMMFEGIMFINPNNKLEYANYSALETLGIEEKDLPISCEEFETVHQNGKQLKVTEFPAIQAYKTRKPVNGIILGIKNKKTDTLRWIKVNAYPIQENQQKTPSQVVTVFNDLTASINLAHKANKYRERLDAALSVANFAWWEWNVEENTVEASDLKAKFIGFKPKDVEKTLEFWTSRIHQDDFDKTMKAMEKCLSGESDIYFAEYRLRTKSNKWKLLQDIGKIVEFSTDGKPKRLIGTVTEIKKK